MSLIAEHLRRQGVKVVEIDKEETVSGEIFMVEKFTKQPGNSRAITWLPQKEI
jgi:hypothetical protein